MNSRSASWQNGCTKVISPLELIESGCPRTILQPKPVIDLSQSELGWQPTVIWVIGLGATTASLISEAS